MKKPSIKKIKDIDLIVYDFDGVLTDNRVIVDENGRESVVTNRSDGMAIRMLKEAGIRQVILTTETNKVVEARARKLKIRVIQGIEDKKDVLLAFCRENDIDLKKTIYIGNDLNDSEVMQAVGYPVCPLDAAEEIKVISRIKLATSGGFGVVRSLLTYLDLNEKNRRR